MNVLSRIVVLTAAVVILAGCGATANHDAGAPPLQLKAYRVPANESEAIASKLGAVLESPEFRAGTRTHAGMRVTQPFPGTVLVLAPASLQASIGSAIADMQAASTKQAGVSAASGPVQVRFWLVDAIPGKGEDSVALKPLSATLDHLRTALGPTHFTVVGAVSAAGTLGERGQIASSGQGQFNFKATPGADGAVDLQVAYSNPDHTSGIANLDTAISVNPGQLVVLAQAPQVRGVNGVRQSTDGKGGTKVEFFDDAGLPYAPDSRPRMRMLVVSVDRPALPSH